MHARSRSPRLRRAAAAALALAALAACGERRGESVARLDAEPTRLTLPYGSFAEIGLGWTPATELEGASGPPRVFLHLLDARGRLARTFDHELPGPWRPGREQRYRARIYQSLLAPPLPPGDYALSAGLYDAEGRRWPLTAAGERVGRDEYRIAAVEVPSRGVELPAVEFSETWSPTLAGADRQVVALRWLSGEGAIRLRELSGEGTLWLGLSVPPAQAGSLRRRIVAPEAESGAAPWVRVRAGCSGFEAQVSGEGRHDVDVPVVPADGGCAVAIQPNFMMESVKESPTEDRRSINLEVIAWKPAPSP